MSFSTFHRRSCFATHIAATRDEQIADTFGDYVATYGSEPPLSDLPRNPLVVARLLGFEVNERERLPDGLAGLFTSFAGGGPHHVNVDPELPGSQQLWVFWHEIAHGLDFTRADGLGFRVPARRPRYSSTELAKSFWAAHRMELAHNHWMYRWHNPALPDSLPTRHVWERILDEYAMVKSPSDRRYDERPKELFAEAFALAVLAPRTCAAVNADMHHWLIGIAAAELATVLTDEALATIIQPMAAAVAETKRVSVAA